MKPYAIVAEGPDDLAALRVLLRGIGAEVKGTFHDANRNPLQVVLNGSTVQVWAARGKKKELTERAIDAAQGTAAYRPEIVVVCFDPDTDPEPSEFQFFATHFEEVRGTRAGPLVIDPTSGATTFQVGDRTVRVVPAPWRLDAAPGFAGLPNEHNLERVLITGLLSVLSSDPRTAWAAQTTAALTALVSDHGWKRAFRIWSAALVPSAEAAVDALLQRREAKDGCLAALRDAHGWQRILALNAAQATVA
jgi:hypothetical protein